MKKEIKQENLDAVLKLLVKYNVGVQEYQSVAQMFNSLPVIKEDNGENTPADKKVK